MHWSAQLATAVVLLGSAGGMIALERARNLARPPFPRTEGGRVTYRMTYCFLLVLGATVLLAVAIR